MLVRIRKHLKAQSTVEYGILIGVIVAAAVAMQTYIKRSIQAKQKDAADMVTNISADFTITSDDVDAGDDVTMSLGATPQYEPYYIQRHQQQNTTEDTLNKDVAIGGATTTNRRQTATTQSAVVYGWDPDLAEESGTSGGTTTPPTGGGSL